MKNQLSANQMRFTPQSYKSFEGALEAFFSSECPQLGGFRTRQVLAKSIIDLVNQFYPETTHLRPGQITWPTVHRDERSSYGKSINQTRLTSVILDLVQSCDAEQRAQGKKLRTIKKEAVARLCKQSYEQEGCITNAEIAILLKISASTVGKYIKEWEQNEGEVLPRRGSIHDIGPTLTHKKIIIEKLFLEQKTVQEVCRETYHSLSAIQRYIGTFKQVLLCQQKGMSRLETAFALKRSERLIKEYEEIIEEYKERSYAMKDMMNFEVSIESNIEKTIRELSEIGRNS